MSQRVSARRASVSRREQAYIARIDADLSASPRLTATFYKATTDVDVGESRLVCPALEIAADLVCRLMSDGLPTSRTLTSASTLGNYVAAFVAPAFMRRVRLLLPTEEVRVGESRSRTPARTVARPHRPGSVLAGGLATIYGDAQLAPHTREFARCGSPRAAIEALRAAALLRQLELTRSGWNLPDRPSPRPPGPDTRHGQMVRESVHIGCGSIQESGRHRLAYAVYQDGSGGALYLVLIDVEANDRAPPLQTACPAVCAWAIDAEENSIPAEVIAMLDGAFSDASTDGLVVEHLLPPTAGSLVHAGRRPVSLVPPPPSDFSVLTKQVQLRAGEDDKVYAIVGYDASSSVLHYAPLAKLSKVRTAVAGDLKLTPDCVPHGFQPAVAEFEEEPCDDGNESRPADAKVTAALMVLAEAAESHIVRL